MPSTLTQRFILLISATLVAACSAKMVSKPGTTTASPYAPVNEATRGGVIKYLNEGIRPVRQKRREDAYKQMFTACDGKYRIDAEGPRTEGGVVVPVAGTAVISDSQYWYIQFSCLRDTSADSTRKL
jgi:hypothetical protein